MLQAQKFSAGDLMWSNGYSDMPYMVEVEAGNIFSALTVTIGGAEGGNTQHVIGLRSTDGGHSWSVVSDIEAAGPPISAWAMPYYDAANNKLYAFYLFNADNTLSIPSNVGAGSSDRGDVVGYLAWRISSDGGMTWGARQQVALPSSAIDAENPFSGAQKLFWFTGHPRIHNGKIYLGVTKCGAVKGARFYHRTEAFLMKASFPALNNWSMLPPSGCGMKAPSDASIAPSGSVIGEEPSFVIFSDGVIYMTYRTEVGFLGDAWSADDGVTWTRGWARGTDGTSAVPQPRAMCAIAELANGKYIMWLHNNAAISPPADPEFGNWNYRNPVWYCIGTRSGNRLLWSDATALMFDSNVDARISYPSLLVHGNELLVAATNKADARVFHYPLSAIEGAIPTSAVVGLTKISQSMIEQVDPGMIGD